MSALRPGHISRAIKKVGEKAVEVSDQEPPGKIKPGRLKFDVKRRKPVVPQFNQDENWVARYRGQNSPAIGNGSGMPIGGAR